jgi:hypothetical protein
MGNADPGGTQVSGPDLEVQVHQVALTREQVREFGLPSTPLQKKERRAAAWHCLAEAAAEALNDEMEHQFEVLQEAVAADAPELPVFEIEPAISATAPEPLFSTVDDFVDASRKLVARKTPDRPRRRDLAGLNEKMKEFANDPAPRCDQGAGWSAPARHRHLCGSRCEDAGFDGVGIDDHPSSGRDAYLVSVHKR